MAKKIQLPTWLARGPRIPFGRRQVSLWLRPRVTALDVDGEVLRLVQTVRRYGRTRVTRVAAKRLDLPPDAEHTNSQVMGKAVATALQQLKWKSSQVVMGIPRAQVVLRTITLPETDHPGELASMVHFQIAKDLPFPVEEAIVDFTVQSRLPSPSSDTALRKAAATKESTHDGAEGAPRVQVLVAAVRKEAVQLYQDIAAAAGFNLATLGLRSYANARCVEACNLTTPGETVALVSLRPDEVIIDVLEGRFLVFSRVASVKQPSQTEDAGDLTFMETASEETELVSQLDIAKPVQEIRFAQAVTIEVVRSLHSYQGTVPRNPVARVVVAGGTGHEQDVVEALQNRLCIPSKLLDPASALGLPLSVREHASGALAVFGLGIGVNDREGLPFDFLHPKRPTPPPSPRRVKVLAAATAALAVLFAVFALRTHLVRKRQETYRELYSLLRQEKRNQPLYKKLQLETQAVLDWKNSARNWLDYYASLSTNLPPQTELYLSSISMSGQGDGVIRMSVLAKSGEILAKLERQLRSVGFEIKPLAINPGPEKRGYNFKSTVELTLPPPQKHKKDTSRPPNTNTIPTAKTTATSASTNQTSGGGS